MLGFQSSSQVRTLVVKENIMVAQVLEIHVDPESETGKQLAEAGERPVRLVSGARKFRLVSDEDVAAREDPFANYNPERAAAAWRASFGVWKGMDTESLKAELKEQRGQDSIGRPGQ